MSATAAASSSRPDAWGSTPRLVPELVVGVVAAACALLFSWIPSLWYDEAATVTSATRSWPQLWRELQSIDLVHGVYYAGMHIWFDIVGYSPFTLRLPSALAVGAAAAFTVATGRTLWSVRFGLVAGLLFSLLPRVVWAGGEGRSYASAMAFAAGLTLIGVVAAERTVRGTPAARLWLAYGAVAAVGVIVDIHLVLVIAAHAVSMSWVAARLRVGAGGSSAPAPLPLVRGFAAAAVAVVVTAPFVLAVSTQSGQAGWIHPLGPATPGQVLQTAWFGADPVHAVVYWGLLVAGVVIAIVGSRRDRGIAAATVAVALPAALLPTAILLAVTAVSTRLYDPRYASLSLPFVALLIAIPIARIRSDRLLAAATAILLVFAAPPAAALRQPHAKQSSHWADAVAILTQNRGPDPRGEGVLFGRLIRHRQASLQIIEVAYPDAFRGMRELGCAPTARARGELWNRCVAPEPHPSRSQDGAAAFAATVPPRLHGLQHVWYIAGIRGDDPGTVATVLALHHFTLSRRWTTGDLVISRFDRRPPAPERGASAHAH